MGTYASPYIVLEHLGMIPNAPNSSVYKVGKMTGYEAYNRVTVDVDSNWALLKLCIFFNLYIYLGLFCAIVLGSMPLKILVGRERPTRIKSVTRIKNIRDHEEGTKSMPSGDATAGSFFLGCYALLL